MLYEYLANMLYLIVISNVVVNLCSNLKLYFIVFISKTFENFLSFKLSSHWIYHWYLQHEGYAGRHKIIIAKSLVQLAKKNSGILEIASNGTNVVFLLTSRSSHLVVQFAIKISISFLKQVIKGKINNNLETPCCSRCYKHRVF